MNRFASIVFAGLMISASALAISQKADAATPPNRHERREIAQARHREREAIRHDHREIAQVRHREREAIRHERREIAQARHREHQAIRHERWEIRHHQ
ncbi:MAG: hypothetical protein V7L05_14620 [Nostoc sp.]|uniref:hypothetical protein n=1 Tax=Nostoc sp. TaxID=1180 RepID=UPI002FF647DF